MATRFSKTAGERIMKTAITLMILVLFGMYGRYCYKRGQRDAALEIKHRLERVINKQSR